MQNYFNILSKSNLFHGFCKSNIKDFFECVDYHKRTFKKDEMVLDETDNKYIFFILSGLIEIAYISPNGDKHIISRLSDGKTFGEIYALSDKPVIHETITALKDTTTLRISVDTCFDTCKKGCSFHLCFNKNLMRILANKAMQLNEKINYLQIKSLRGRLCTYFYSIFIRTSNTLLRLPYNRNELASFLNVSRPSMSREMSRMKHDGLIDYSGRQIQILDLDEIIKHVH